MKIVLAAVTMILSASAYATSYNDLYDVVGNNHDFYSGSTGSSSLSTAVQPGIGDQYGSSFLYSDGVAKSKNTTHTGYGDGYASSLIDVGANERPEYIYN